MHSLRGWKWAVYGGLIGSVCSAVLPTITPAPELDVEFWVKRQQPDALSFARMLLTAIPLSLRQIAATNAPAVSSILWEQFLDNKKPQWFLDLPWDIQSYLIKEFGPETAWLSASPTTSSVQTTSISMKQPSISTASLAASTSGSSSAMVSSGATPSSLLGSSTGSTLSGTASRTLSTSKSSSSRLASSKSAPKSSATIDPVSPPSGSTSFTKNQKIGLGVGIPLAILGAAAFLFACCFLCRRKRNKHVNGREPPSSPGFIPRFAFHEQSADHYENRAPLNPTLNHSSHDLGTSNWEDDGVDLYEHPYAPAAFDGLHAVDSFPPTAAAGMATIDAQPIMAPAIYHTHSSNRARGTRTSYSSLHSVAEVTEPDEDVESPILGRQTTPLQRKRRPSMPMVLEISPNLVGGRTPTLKRKPVPMSAASEAASRSLLRPALTHTDHSGSSSSGLALSSNSSLGRSYHTETASPVSPLSEHPDLPTNPFSNDFSYVEDYGPEYQGGYLDHDNGVYGGNRSLDQYSDPSTLRKSSKTEWPLRNLSTSYRRNKSPMWDRVYESP